MLRGLAIKGLERQAKEESLQNRQDQDSTYGEQKVSCWDRPRYQRRGLEEASWVKAGFF